MFLQWGLNFGVQYELNVDPCFVKLRKQSSPLHESNVVQGNGNITTPF